MLNSNTIEKNLKGNYAGVDFTQFIPSKENVFPDLRIYDFMMLGPFVLETEGAFETEYFYEREKALNHDYLASSGGEAAQIPYFGKAVKNDYYGPGTLKWRKGIKKWDQFRFYDEGDPNENAIFATEQRNCVFYAAVYIDCAQEQDAVLVHETSGCKIYLNGELIDNQPYGRVKGLWSSGKKVSVHFNKGKNLLMMKIRPGYIADTFDLTISNCSIYPVAVKTDKFGVTYPLPTALFFGTHEKPLQMFQCYSWSMADIKEARISYGVDDYVVEETFTDINSTESSLIRMKLPVSDKAGFLTPFITVMDDTDSKTGKICVETLPVTPFDGYDYRFADFHFDTTYHQEQRTYAMGAFHITKCLVDKLIDDPDFKAILSEVDYLHPYYSIYPKHRKAIREAFEQGRAEADCFYNQPNELTSSGEGVVRNLVYGQLYHRDVLGRITHVYAPGDVFGHPNQLTQICMKGGCKALQWGKYVLGLDWVFRHVSPDGTIGLHNKGVSRHGALTLGLKHCSGGSDLRTTVLSLPADGKTGWMKESLNHSRYGVFSEMIDGLLEDVEEAEVKKERKVDLVSRDLTQHHSGVLLTRTDFKQANRLAENLLITAEKFATIASYYGATYPEKALDKAWRQLLCAQHHDSITGTNNEISYVDLMIEYRESIDLAAEIANNAVAFIASGIQTNDGEQSYAIFNPHCWNRKDKCEIMIPSEYENGCELIDSKGEKYPVTVLKKLEDYKVKAVFVADVPAFGYETYLLKHCEAEVYEIGNHNTIENEFYKITVDENLGGGIVSIIDKECGKEVLDISKDGPANRVVILKELNDRMEEQHEFYTTGHKMVSSDYKALVSREICDAFQKIIIKVKLDIVATIKQEIILWKNIKRIDLNTIVEDYQGIDDLFVLTFPLNITGAQPIFDDRFAPHVWSESQRKLSFQTHQYASFSHSKIAPVNQWIELGRTVRAVFDKGDINIGMTAIIRNPSLYEETDDFLVALSKKAIPVTPYSDKEQYGSAKIVHFNEDLDNTDTRFVLSVDGVENEYEKKILSEISAESAAEFHSKFAENGSAVLFTKDCNNAYGKSIDVIMIKADSAKSLLAILQKCEKELAIGNVMNLSQAVLAEEPGYTENYGVALLNKGTISCSVEPDNLLTMMLFHTANFYGNAGKTTGEQELIPEQKTHSFSYALYPHAGDYREAEVYRKAFEFNDPLLFAECTSGHKILPQSNSFLQSSKNFVVTSFKAGGYPMASMKSDFSTVENRGFAVRGFEVDGIEKEITLKSGFEIGSVTGVNLLEEEAVTIKHGDDTIAVQVNPHSIETFLVQPIKAEHRIERAVLGAEKEVVEPTYVRSWEHDLGSMNMGYLSVAGIIGKDVEKLSDTQYRFNISMANNHLDTAIKGVMKLSLSEGFTADVTTIAYDIEPEGIEEYKVTVTKPSADASGILRLNYSHDGQTFEDMYEFGYFNPEVSLEIIEDKIVAKVINNTQERIYGELAIATPFETWNAQGLNGEARMSITPRTQKFEVPSGESMDYEFSVKGKTDGVIDAYWAVVKLMANGRIHFAYDHKKGSRHNIWAHEFANILFERDKGSIKELLEL